MAYIIDVWQVSKYVYDGGSHLQMMKSWCCKFKYLTMFYFMKVEML